MLQRTHAWIPRPWPWLALSLLTAAVGLGPYASAVRADPAGSEGVSAFMVTPLVRPVLPQAQPDVAAAHRAPVEAGTLVEVLVVMVTGDGDWWVELALTDQTTLGWLPLPDWRMATTGVVTAATPASGPSTEAP